MAPRSKKDAQLQADLAALGEASYAPVTTTEKDAALYGITLKFDYDEIEDSEAREIARDAAREINMRRRRAASDLIVIGTTLLQIRELVPRQFEAWMMAEFDYGMTAAREFMNIARRFADDPTLVADIPVTVLRVLGSPSLPDEGVKAILDLATEKQWEGDTIQVSEAKAIASDFRSDEDKRPQRRERIARTIAGNYSVQQDDPIVATLLNAEESSPELRQALKNANKEQLYKTLSLLPPDDTSRRALLENVTRAFRQQDAHAAQDNGAQSTAISTRRKDGVFVELPRAIWGKMIEAFKAFDMNPIISDKESARILKTIEQSLETQ